MLNIDPTGNKCCCITGIQEIREGNYQGGKKIGDYWPKGPGIEWHMPADREGKVGPTDDKEHVGVNVQIVGTYTGDKDCGLTQHLYTVTDLPGKARIPEKRKHDDLAEARKRINPARESDKYFNRQWLQFFNGKISFADPPWRRYKGDTFTYQATFTTCFWSGLSKPPSKDPCSVVACCINWRWTANVLDGRIKKDGNKLKVLRKWCDIVQ